jgi:hypothetical protein
MIKDKSVPIPSAPVLSQCRSIMDQALMLHTRSWMREVFSVRADDERTKPVVWLLADSSPQAGVNWLCSEVWIVCTTGGICFSWLSM